MRSSIVVKNVDLKDLEIKPNYKFARERLSSFINNNLKDYSKLRNYDFGPEKRENTSFLSPFISSRIIPEWEVLNLMLDDIKQYEKFTQEIIWKNYWRGWLELRPQVWTDYISFVDNYNQTELYRSAICGEVGIECFDSWVKELISNGYLHNHARMWFASIWIFTLKLPWQLGADLFYKHLLDIDPAANTLSWRWVAGLHTKGKCYLASNSNITKYTDGRFRGSKQLATESFNICDASDYKASEPKLYKTEAEISDELKDIDYSLVVYDQDMHILKYLCAHPPKKIIYIPLHYIKNKFSAKTMSFKEALNKDYLGTFKKDQSEISDISQINKADNIYSIYPNVGHWHDFFKEEELLSSNIKFFKRSWDQAFIPYCSAGFFKFKKAVFNKEFKNFVSQYGDSMKEPSF